MTKPVNLKEEREKRTPKCPYCAGPAHDTDLLCPRVSGVTYHEDGAFTVEFDMDYLKPDKDEED